MATRTPDAPEQDVNYTQDEYDNKFNHAAELGQLRKLEDLRDHPSAVKSRAELNNEQDDDLKDKEEKGPWDTDFQRQQPAPEKGGRQNFVAAMKKRGPAGAIVALLIAGMAGFSFLTPGLLMLHITETLTDKLNMQYPSMDIRTNRVLSKKLSNQALTGICTQRRSFRCDFQTLNDRQLRALRAAGIEITLDENTTITGRHKVLGMKMGDLDVDPEKLSTQFQEHPNLRNAFKSAYNPRFAGFGDKVATGVYGIIKVTLGNSLAGASTDEERATKMKDNVENGFRDEVDTGRITKYEKTDIKDPNDSTKNLWEDEDGNRVSEDTALRINDAIDRGDFEGIKSVFGSSDKKGPTVLEAAHNTLDSASPDIGSLKSIAGAATGGILAAPDAACGVYGAYRAVSFGAKTIRAVQMARYAMPFLTMASMIKAGDATPEEVAYFANLLTKTVTKELVDESGNKTKITTKAATDSYGYNYVANFFKGPPGPPTASAAEFMAGGGLGGKMDGMVDTIFAQIPFSDGKKNQEYTKKVCGIIKSPLGQAGGVLVSLGLLIFGGPIGWTALVAGVSGGVATDMALQAAKTVLTPVLADLVAGKVIDDSTFGEKTGDALVSGSGFLMSSLAGAGGNAPLRPDQAVAYMSTQREVIARHAEEERLARSPLDPSSPYTFAGKIFGQLVPYSSQTTSISSFVATSASVAKRSFASILNPSVLAAEDSIATYTQCDDLDYREINLATDPFCNPIRGIPTQYLNDDPDDIIQRLIDGQFINEDDGTARADGAGEKFSEFVKDCINRDRPLGDQGEEFNLDSGEKCFIEESDGLTAQQKADIYVYHIDARIIDGMENGYDRTMAGESTRKGGGARISEAELRALIKEYGLPDPIAEDKEQYGDYSAPQIPGMVLVQGYDRLLKQLTDDPNATWATEAMLAAEKNFQDKGGSIKEYLNSTWLWFESGSANWPDPYEVNCGDIGKPDQYKTGRHCQTALMQSSGYQAWDRQNDYVKEFNRFYTESDLKKVLQDALANSKKASQPEWNYHDEKALVGGETNYIQKLMDEWMPSATLSQIAPDGGSVKTDAKTQFLTLLMGKDPNISTALNSYAVTDDDVLAHLGTGETCGPGWGSYICKPERQLMSNMIYALYQFDSIHGSSIDVKGSGIGSIIGDAVASQVAPFEPPTHFDCGLYDYGKAYGTDGCRHTGTDIMVPKHAPIYSPVSGTIRCARTTQISNDGSQRVITDGGPGTNGEGCAAFNSYLEGTPIPNSVIDGDGRVEIELDNGHVLILGHIYESMVKVGDRVEPGQQIGTNGFMNSWHVHVEYRVPDEGTDSNWRVKSPEEMLGGTVKVG